MKNVLLILLVPALMASCAKDDAGPLDFNVLKNLPADSGGVQKAHVLNSTEAPYGFYAYTPSAYTSDGPEYPLLIFLHGMGEIGNSASDAKKLELVLRNGPPMLIKKNKWQPRYPMIVVSPQCHHGWWESAKVHELITYLAEHYQVNKKRIYITGLSMGGYGTFGYVGDYGDESYAAACVPICGGGDPKEAKNFGNTPTWIFHGDADGTVNVNQSINMATNINNLNPAQKAKLTIYPGVSHNSWSMTYDGTGMGKESKNYDAFSQSIYDWMFEHEKQLPETAKE
ncbi:MAG: hypothetical protein HC819_21760 [Cyclobacteriaceae bacterium]|nr:hypothetical protein [Cyclobacteriaceae bacterium]